MKVKSGLSTYSRQMVRIRKQLPYIIARALNDTAFDARRAWEANARSSMKVGKSGNVLGLRVQKATARNQMAVVGSHREFMALQETGGPKGPGNKSNKPASTVALPVGRRRRRRTIGNIQIHEPMGLGGIGSSKQRRAAMLRQARKVGASHVMMEINGKRGLFKIGARSLQKLWDITHPSVTVKKNPMMSKAIKVAKYVGPKNYRAQLAKEIAYSNKRLSRF